MVCTAGEDSNKKASSDINCMGSLVKYSWAESVAKKDKSR